MPHRAPALLLACWTGLSPLAGARSRPPAPPSDPRSEAEGDRTLSPYFFVKGEAAVDQLPLKATSAQVAIAGVVADVTVTQVYRNTGTKPLEAVYVFPGSTRSAVHAMTMRIGERVLRAQIRERGQARADYERAKQEGRSASLLEQQRPNVFQMNVANILPGDEIRVELCYTELLVPTAGTYEFVFPTVVGPRYAGRSGTASDTGEAWVANPYTHAGEKPATTFDLSLTLAAGLPIARMGCDTHRTTLAYDGKDRATLRLDPLEAHGGNRDFILKYQLAGGAVQSGLLLDQGKDGNTFLVMAQPPKRVAPKDLPPREYVFIMDVSGSQMGFPLEVSKGLMKEMIQGLRPQDRFNVMVFEGSAAFWSPEGSVAATPEHTREALAFVGAQHGGGGTELASALRKALGLPRVPGISRTFVVSTDGYISADGQVFDLIRQNLGSANLFAFGIGSSVNRHLIEGMAHAGQGEAFVVTRPDQAAAEAERFRAYVSAPVLTDVRLTTNGFAVKDLEPVQLPDVLADRPVICLGRWTGAARGTVTISGVTGAGPWHQTFDVAQVADRAHPALAQLWARQRIQRLADYDPFGADEERKAEVTRLGLAYHLLTAYTSFVAVDTQVRNTGGRATILQPLPLPEGVSDAAIGGGALASLPAQRMTPAPVSLVVEAAAQDQALSRESRYRAKADPGRAVGDTSAAGRGEGEPPEALPVARIRSLSAPAAPDLSALRQELQARLGRRDLRTALAGLPSGTVLVLKLDAAGRVISAAFQKGFAGSARAVALLEAWRLQAWGGRAGEVRITLAGGR